MIKISDWYSNFADVSFPTVFVKLTKDEKDAIINNSNNDTKKKLWKRFVAAIEALPRGVVVNADCVAPSDSKAFKQRRVLHTPISSWKQLTTSEKVIEALKNDLSDTICFRPYRRMDKAREFRLFIKDGELLAASQYNLTKNYPKIMKRKEQIWQILEKFYKTSIVPFLTYKDVVIDVYLCSDNSVKIIDFNDFGGKTEPLLLRTFDQDLHKFMEKREPLLLLASPAKMEGDISISF